MSLARSLDVRVAACAELLVAAPGGGRAGRAAGTDRHAGRAGPGHRRCWALRVTLKQLSGTEPGATGSVRKLLGMRHAQQVAELCWSMSGTSGALGGHGGGGPVRDGAPDGAHWARQVLQTRALTIGGGTTDIQLNIIGERILGLPRDPDRPATPALVAR